MYSVHLEAFTVPWANVRSAFHVTREKARTRQPTGGGQSTGSNYHSHHDFAPEREKLLLLWTAPKLSTPPPIQPPRESPCPPTLRSRPSSRRGPGCAMLSSLLPTGTPTPPATASSVFGTSSFSQRAAIPAGSIGQLFISLGILLAKSRLCASEVIESIEG
jgi:hypothetical protein